MEEKQQPKCKQENGVGLWFTHRDSREKEWFLHCFFLIFLPIFPGKLCKKREEKVQPHIILQKAVYGESRAYGLEEKRVLCIIDAILWLFFFPVPHVVGSNPTFAWIFPSTWWRSKLIAVFLVPWIRFFILVAAVFFYAAGCVNPYPLDTHQKNVVVKDNQWNVGVWPSGKASEFGSGNQRFESFHPSAFIFSAVRV